MTTKKIVDELYDFVNHYFDNNPIEKAIDKQADIEKKLKEVLEQIDSLCFQDAEKQNETEYLYQKGRAINVLSDHDQRAEDCLSKAVKRNPKSWEAWNELGLCYWKKGEVEMAKNCFEGALRQEQNKISLRSLSMILRQMGKTSKEQISFIHESLEKAESAVELDKNDGLSWYILGNSYFSLFFLANQNQEMLNKCMNAYNLALKDSVSKTHPDLHLNRATALRYEGSYQAALDSYQQAIAYDPTWSNPKQKSQELLDYLKQIQLMVATKNCLKTRQIKNTLKNLKPHHLGTRADSVYKQMKLEELKEGLNLKVIVLGKVIGLVPQSYPFTFCLMDENEFCVSVAVYNQADGKGVIMGDSVAVPDPLLRLVEINSGTGKQSFSFRTIQVSSPLNLVVNGRQLRNDQHAPPTLSVICTND